MLYSRSLYWNSMAYFYFVHRSLFLMFHSIFAWKRKHQSLVSYFRERESTEYRMLGSSVICIVLRECLEYSTQE